MRSYIGSNLNIAAQRFSIFVCMETKHSGKNSLNSVNQLSNNLTELVLTENWIKSKQITGALAMF